MSKPIKAKPNFRTIDVTVRGLPFYVTPYTLGKMAKATPMPVILEREPKNVHDPNAIKVILDVQPWQGFHIGHVAKATALTLAPKMDNGTLNLQEAWLMWVTPDKGEGGLLLKVRKG